MNVTDVVAAGSVAWLPGLAWGALPDWLVVLTAAIGVWLAVRQLTRVAEANTAQAASNQLNASIARAELVLQIDARFESADIVESRLAIRTLRNHCEARVKAASPGLNDERSRTRRRKHFRPN